MYFLPSVLSAVAISLVWKWLYHQNYGLINAMLGALGLPAQGFINSCLLYTSTGMTQGVIDERGDALQSQIALRRLGEPQDVGNAVAFLCSDAASYLTGMFLEITGGKFCVQNPDYAWKMLNRD